MTTIEAKHALTPAPPESDAAASSPARTGEAAAEARRALERQRSVWKYLGMFMAGIRQYGWHHPEPRRNLKLAHDELVAVLDGGAGAVWWDVSPYAILFDGVPVWEPDRPPFDRVPFQLFGDGLRRLQASTGISEDELGDLVAILVHDPSSGLGPDDDTVNGLWDRRFEHVAYLAVDNLAEGDATERDAFERECDEVAERVVTRARLGQAGWPGEVVAKNPYALPESLRTLADAAAALSLDEATRTRLASQSELPSDRWTERYVDAFAQGWVEAMATGDVGLVSGALSEWTQEQIQLRRRGVAFGMYNAMRQVFTGAASTQAARDIDRQIARIMFPEPALRGVMQQIADESRGKSGDDLPKVESSVASGLGAALDQIEDDRFFADVCEWLETCPVEGLRPSLLAYIERFARGHEVDLAPRIADGSVDVAIALVRVLGGVDTLAAQHALGAAFDNPHVPVRIEALARLPGANAERVGEELRKLMNDDSPQVRGEVLAVVRRLQVKAAGPALALRVQGPHFDKLTVEERREALATLQVLNPGRFESIAIEILARTRLIPRKANETSRMIAADALAEHAASRAALEATKKFSKRRWYNTPPVRAAAQKAAAQIEARLGVKQLAQSSGAR